MESEKGVIQNVHYGDILTRFPAVLDCSKFHIPFLKADTKAPGSDDFLKDGDVVFADTAEDYSTGKAIEIVGSNVVVSGLHTIPCRPKQPFAPGYLGFYLNSPGFRKQLLPLIQGIKVYSISKSSLNVVFLNVPCFLEQQKVAAFLIAIDKRISVQNKIIEASKSLIKPLFESLNDVKTKSFTLKDLGVYSSAETLSWDDMCDRGNPTIIYGQLFTDYSLIIRDVIGRSSKKGCLSTGNDILFPASTTVDNLSLISPASLKLSGVNLGGDMFSIALFDWIDFDYLSLAINLRYKRELARLAQGTTIIHIHWNDIKNFKVQLPCLEEQKKIARACVCILEKIDVEKQIREKLLLEKQFLLQNLFI